MTTYRLAEFGVERIDEDQSTFIPADSQLPSWREFATWCDLGNEPQPMPVRTAFPPRPKLRNLWIIGAGGYGREIFGMTLSAHGSDVDWRVAGFLSDIPSDLELFPELPRIQGTTEYRPSENEVFICAIGDPAGRRAVCEGFKRRGARFINLIQKSAAVSKSVGLGEGIIIEAFTGIGADSRIGDFTTILGHVSIAHDVVIGPWVQISPFASLLGRVQVDEGVMIGSHAVILPGIKIGAGATVGAGSVVIQDVPPHSTIFGVPAKPLR